MAVVLNPYANHQAQLGVLETGLKSLKTDRTLMADTEFSDMYWAVERHHRDLKLAHLTGKAKDLMVQAERDTKFYNILIKMLCEVKRLPGGKQRDSLKKVHLWYMGNRHTLASGPRFGKAMQQMEANDALLRGSPRSKSGASSARRVTTSKSANSLAGKQANKENKRNNNTGDFRTFVTETRDDVSSAQGFGESMNPSEPASSRLSHHGNDFLTNRFLMDLPTSKLSWHLESGYEGLQTPTDWDGADSEIQRVAESVLSRPVTFDDQYHASHPSVPNSSPQSQLNEDSPRSVGSGGSSQADVGSADMMDFQSDFRSRLSRRHTSAGSGKNMSEDQSSSEMYGLPKKMVHSIASLVNPHAKLAETEAKKAEQDFHRVQSAASFRTTSRGQGSAGIKGEKTDLSAHIPVLRAVSVSSNRVDGINNFSSFRKDHLYGQDILNLSGLTQCMFRSESPLVMPPIPQGKLNFVGRSGTALDVRYSAHAQGDMPENHTKEVIQLYSMYSDNNKPVQSSNDVTRVLTSPRICQKLINRLTATMPSVYGRPAVKKETFIHNQTLEDFYQTAENYYPTNLPKYRNSRIQSAPAPRVKSGKTARSAMSGNKTSLPHDKKAATKFQANQKLGKHLEKEEKKSPDTKDVGHDEVLYTGPSRPASAVRLESVVTMIDQVKDEMNYFREKLAPTPMPGFRQPASVSVSNKPLSRPGSTASRMSRPSTSRSRAAARSPSPPSPQARPGTPMETDELMMGEPEVPNDTFRHNTMSARPHSATVTKAVDWRGKITPEATRIRSKTRFGGHTYVQKLKPSLRTAGASNAGKRPKTAPISMKDRWGTKEKEETETTKIKLPPVKIQNYPSLVTREQIQYPVKRLKEKHTPILAITECEKNQRIPQAASNTVTQIDDTDMDRIMNIQHILGTSDSRYGSMGSLFLDEEFLRSFNARYTTTSSMTMYTTGSQNREFLSIVGPTPRMSPSDSRAQSRQTVRRTDIHVQQIPEESTVKEEDSNFITTETGPTLDNEENQEPDTQEPEDTAENQDIGETPRPPAQTPVTDQIRVDREENPRSEVPVTTDDTQSSEVKVTKEDTPRSEVKFAREVVHVQSEEREGDVHIEVTAVPASGCPKTQPTDIGDALQGLSQSEVWNYQPVEGEGQDFDISVYIDGEGKDRSYRPQRSQSAVIDRRHIHSHHQEPCHHHNHQQYDTRSGQWSKSVVKPENYCFHCLPDSMSTKIGRSAGRMPGGAQSPAGQVLRMARRQNDYFKKAPPVRTPPSIPSPHHPLGGRSPRTGQQYISELEHHARKENSPRHYMEQVVELRKDNCKSAPPGTRVENDDMLGSLSVVRLCVQERAQTAPINHLHQQQSSDNFSPLPSHEEEKDEEIMIIPTGKRVGFKPPPTTSQSLAHIGRPIAQVSHIPDPDELAEASMKQREAKAAVDIQRIFRGYVCRNSYRKLLWENRKEDEDKQKVLVENQREFRKHQGRKAKIYNRPPLDPNLLQWAKDFKDIQVTNEGKRQVKVDNMAKEMLANQQKAKSKIEVIGPHVEIYDIYHPKEVGPSKREMHKASVEIQRHVRGFLVRKRFERLRRKATFCGMTWKQAVMDYKNLLIRVQRWHSVEKAVTPFSVQEMYDYMDIRRRYESQFDKKSFGEELELNDLEAFFRECDLYPSKAEIDDGLDVTTKGQSIKKGKGLQKNEAMNLLFYIYVPPATGLTNTRQSTWMNPIIDGVEARKLIGEALLQEPRKSTKGSEYVEKAPLVPCANLVIASRRERKQQEDAEIERLRQLERQKKGEISDDDSEDSKKSSPIKRRSVNMGRGPVSQRGSKPRR